LNSSVNIKTRNGYLFKSSSSKGLVSIDPYHDPVEKIGSKRTPIDKKEKGDDE